MTIKLHRLHTSSHKYNKTHPQSQTKLYTFLSTNHITTCGATPRHNIKQTNVFHPHLILPPRVFLRSGNEWEPQHATRLAIKRENAVRQALPRRRSAETLQAGAIVRAQSPIPGASLRHFSRLAPKTPQTGAIVLTAHEIIPLYRQETARDSLPGPGKILSEHLGEHWFLTFEVKHVHLDCPGISGEPGIGSVFCLEQIFGSIRDGP